ncbi:hypothetical protein ID144_05945 [Pseudomonas sp. JM0905a]|uniref:hypothetical protein n=1 Tax=Pseudomonas sp. JM0905a TaxID=2772484 RepID=UPI0016841D59|nr:hypothetical protein [Pseudomonas sp. JM0905a]MBD2836578.1 hypothetical protein [Pseudomonas sp. JM0905a]
MAVWRGLGFVAIVLLGVAIAALRGIDAWRKEPVIATLHLPPTFKVARDFDFGRYRLSWSGRGLIVYPQGRPEKVLWAAEGGFLAAGMGRAVPGLLDSGRELHDLRDRLCREQSLEAFERLGSRLSLKGQLRCVDGALSSYVLTLEDDGERGLVLVVTLGDSALNRLYLSWRREPGERIFGFGEVSGVYDMSGRRLAVPAAGGRPVGEWSTSATQAFFVTSRLRAFQSESGVYQLFDLRDPKRVGLEVHEGRLKARIYKGESLEELRALQSSVPEVVSTPAPPK